MAYAPFTRPIAAEASFSLASIQNGSTDRDWSQMFSEDGERGYEVILPTVRRSDVEERASDLWDDYPKEKALYDVDGDAVVSDEDLRDAFWQADGGDEWRDSFEPMMNFGWAVDLRYESSDALTAIANRFHEWGLACTLIEVGTERENLSYEIALTGGGMNLTDHIAAAYIACGQVPPIRILDSLTGSFPSSLVPRLPMDEVIDRAVSWLEHRAESFKSVKVRCQELTAGKEAGA